MTAVAAAGRRHWRRPPLIANPLLRWSLIVGAAVYLAGGIALLARLLQPATSGGTAG